MNSRVRRIINHHTYPNINVFTYTDILKLYKRKYRIEKKHKDMRKRWLKAHLDFVRYAQGYVDKHISSIYFKDVTKGG